MAAETPAGRVLDAAIRVAAMAPDGQGRYVHAALVPWSVIHQLRKALDEAGVEWHDRAYDPSLYPPPDR